MRKLLKTRLPFFCVFVVATLVLLGDLLGARGRAEAGKAPVRSRIPGVQDGTGIFVPELSVSESMRNWVVQIVTNEAALRDDPFLYPDPAQADDSDLTPVQGRVAPPNLHGISMGSGKALAVLDRTVVGEGDEVGSWRVDKIESDVVWVEGPSGRIGLRVNRDASRSLPKASSKRSSSKSEATRDIPKSARSQATVPTNNVPLTTPGRARSRSDSTGGGNVSPPKGGNAKAGSGAAAK